MWLQYYKKRFGTAGLLILRLCSLLVITVAYSGCDTPPPPPPPAPPWEVCECDTQEYVLGVSGRPEEYTISPERPVLEIYDYGFTVGEYSKGELITITYHCPDDKIFLFWNTNPPSYMANFSEYPTMSLCIASAGTGLFPNKLR